MKLFVAYVTSEFMHPYEVDTYMKVAVNARHLEDTIRKELKEEYPNAFNSFNIDIQEINEVDGYEIIVK